MGNSLRFALCLCVLLTAPAGCKQLAPYAQIGATGDGGSDERPSTDGGESHDGAGDAGDAAPGTKDGTTLFDAAPLKPGTICSVDDWCWENPLPQGNDLLGVWAGLSATYMVGRAGTILRYDGSEWSGRTGVIEGDFEGVWASSDTDEAWAVGTGGQIFHIEGSTGANTPMDSRTSETLHAIWGDGRGRLHAVGDGGTLLFYDSTGGWRPAPTTLAGDFSEDLHDVWGQNATEIYAAGSDGTVLYYDGSAWRDYPGPPDSTVTFDGICALDTGEVFVVSAASKEAYRQQGGAWEALADASLGSADLWCTSGGEVFASDRGGPLQRLNDTEWVSADQELTNIETLHGDDSGLQWAVGSKGRIYRDSPNGWQPLLQYPATTTARSISGTSATDVWVVGADRRLQHRGSTGWSAPLSEPVSFSPNAIWATSATEIFAVGENGSIARLDGTQWEEQQVGANHLNALWGLDRNTLFAAGNSTTLLRYDGSRWTNVGDIVTGPGQTIGSLWGTGANDVYAGADKGVFLHYAGVRLNPFAPPSELNSDVNGLWGTSATNFFVGGIGKIFRFDGADWHEWSLEGVSIMGIYGSGPTEIYAIGRDGLLLRESGGDWIPRSSGTQHSLYNLWGINGFFIATGPYGTILTKQPTP